MRKKKQRREVDDGNGVRGLKVERAESPEAGQLCGANFGRRRNVQALAASQNGGGPLHLELA